MKYVRIAPFLGLVLLAGCAGKPTTYLSLATRPSALTLVAEPGAPLAVAHVRIPPSLDRLYLTSQLAPNQLHVAAHARWAAPLDGLIQRVIAQDLAQRLTACKVLMPGDPIPNGGVRLVRLNIDQFVFKADGQVVLSADWSVIAPHHRSASFRRTSITVPSGRSPTEQAAAMSTALGQLAGKMAQYLAIQT